MKSTNNKVGSGRNFYITTPIFYPNAKLHLGHAYTTTLCDILARHHRLLGDKTYFLTGSDENTQKMVDSARKEGKEPMDFLDGIVANFTDLYSKLSISYDQFIRTTDQKLHWRGAEALWQRLVAAGDIYKKQYEGLYCVGHEAFITEKDLVDDKCPDHGTVPERLKEENYFFRLSKYTDLIRSKIENDELLIIPGTRKNEILSFIDSRLEDVSFSRPRKADWPKKLGIPVPGDNSQVMYVWCDALANYITALGFGGADDKFKEFWPADVHVIGKDILRFHAAIWPAMLISAGLALPKQLLVHGFINSGGKKMSKTLNNVIDPLELIEEYGADAVRYFLARHISPFEDGDITKDSFKEAYNANLANGIGNLVSRIMKMAVSNGVKFDEDTAATFSKTKETSYMHERQTKSFDSFDIKAVADAIWEEIGTTDREIQTKQPFNVIKTDKEKGREMIKVLLARLYYISAALKPIMPATAKIIEELVTSGEMPEKSLFLRKD